jgi:hypothetical protein
LYTDAKFDICNSIFLERLVPRFKNKNIEQMTQLPGRPVCARV